MADIIDIKSNGTLKISVTSKFLNNVRNAHTWYTSQTFATPMLALLAAMDIGGFYQVAQSTIGSKSIIRWLIIASFAVAFEIAPLYIGYAICLKSYNLGKPIHNTILVLSTISFVLGIIANILYRVLTIESANLGNNPKVRVAITIIMIVLPFITSLMNLVIGCLSFDPLFFDIAKLTKKRQKLELYKRQLEGRLHELADDDSLSKLLEDSEKNSYIKVKNEILILRSRLRIYALFYK